MAEDLAKAIVVAAEKIESKETISKGVTALALKQVSTVPLYEFTQKMYRRNNENDSFELCGFKSWYNFGVYQKIYHDVFTAVNDLKYKSFYDPNNDEVLDNAFLGRVVEEEFSIDENNYKHHVIKKIFALYQRKRKYFHLGY